ncbi:putative U-box domain-containing protein 42 isoform X2 [Argentina anserina]|uniref:putative U-box domain-containing protein 42 isoform X2 n=1 Tax=Argentina anserina TaxID=57926 RepID=UPI00217688F7|nr:putative U-box domain-containing protein 42 isoform X2 [Potentilla anserina]
MALKEYGSPIESLSEFILSSISDITVLVLSVAVEQETFIETACYLYRASVAIMELMTTDYTCHENAMENFQSISRSVNLAKLLVEKCQKGIQPFSDPDLVTITAQLEAVIKHIGERLSFIPPSTFGDQHYAKSSVQSLSKEMQTAHFEAQASKTNGIDKKLLSFRKQPKVEPVSTPTEIDLYSINFEVSTENPQFLNTPQLIQMLRSSSWVSKRIPEDMSESLTSMPPVGQYMEPMYETFFCPLTNKIMEDPVTIRSGVTFERKAIIEWFEKLNGSEQTMLCPTTGQKLTSKAFNENIALKTTIKQWKERNEAARIKAARAALSLASSDTMVLEAVKEVQSICRRDPYNTTQVCRVGILPLLFKCLEYKNKDIRSTVLELLLQLIEDADESKEMIAQTTNIPTIIEMLSSSHRSIRHASMLLLLELSRSQALCEKIGSVTGAILMLITMKYGRSYDAFASEKADEILRNLELSPNNIKRMAENGLMEPLLKNLVEGCEELKIDMANFLGEIVLGHDSKTYVAQMVSATLIKMVHSGNTLARSAAFRTLVQLSSYQPNANILVEAGIVQVMVEEMFIRKIHNEPMNSKGEAAAIVANIFESGLELENLQVNSHGHTMTSDYVVHNIVYMLNNSTPDELNNNLIRILLVLAKIPKPKSTIVTLVKETEASYTLIELINNPHEELSIAAIKLLTVLAPHIGHLLAERLCKTRGQPESLLVEGTETTLITEKQAVSAKFLAILPHQNLTLNLALLYKNIVPTVRQEINQIQKRGTRPSRFESTYFEGLVGILVRFTTTLYEPQLLFLAKNQNFTTVFTELLMKTSSDEIQRLSAIGLENLSLESISLSKPPQIKRKKFMKLFYLPKYLSFGSSRRRRIALCPVHRGACSSQNTFCIVDAKAVEKLLDCLENENPEVVEAALSAISTLLDDKVDVDKSVSMLSEINTVQHILNAVKEHRQEGLRQKSFWVLEKFLNKGSDESVSYISNDRVLPAILVSSFHHGVGNTRQMAEKILRHLNKMPNLYT